ncbi:hypothetical protein A3F65_03500 [Candidatus Saccharibacteria bacterium RIFCSPHIGHO2_12_FULL_47_16b]|nr:MAG: hypothetical protein A3F65_03500 [Candidatus Saccharibacteria bacterium RIFCSPHIGHO2_12_FULL_47_16b]
MERQGFPSVQAPFSIISGTYFVDDPKIVDEQIGKPISEIALTQPKIKTVTTQSSANTISAFVQYQNDTEPNSANANLEKAVRDSGRLPSSANIFFRTIDVSKYTPQDESYELLIAFYSKSAGVDIGQLTDKAKAYAEVLNAKRLSLVDKAEIINPFSAGVNPQTGEPQSLQTSFDRYGERQDGKTVFYNDVVIGIKAKGDADAVKLYEQINSTLAELNREKQFAGYEAKVSAAFGPDITTEINELQRTLIEGLLAVLVFGTLLIALRASLLVIISMATVLAITIAITYLIGYSFNVIILFSLIIALALIVDDTIIMTEAVDVERRRQKDAKAVVKVATRKVSLAMLAATSTAILGFMPLAFITGILGGFIRPIPVTIAIALITSLIVALTIIPLAARWLILGKNNIGPNVKVPLTVKWQEDFARLLTKPLRWAKYSGKRLSLLGASALIISFVFIFGGMFIFKYLEFNIFPSNKDSNQLSISLQFPNGSDISSTQSATDKVDAIVADTLGDNLKQMSYYATATPRMAQAIVYLKPYDQRAVKAPHLVSQLKERFKNFNDASVTVGQADTGGPPGVFSVFIQTPDRANAMALTKDIATFLQGRELKRLDGSKALITTATVSNDDLYIRKDNKQLVSVEAKFDATDTSTLVNLAKEVVDKEYTSEKLAKYNLKKDNLVYDFGFESENQESFNAMLVAFPILLVLMYFLLAIEFRSLLQPVLIFMAIPFSFFGVTGGLWLTDNPFSFFTMLGFFALVGLSIKNTILLVDYANQGRRAGLGRVDAIAAALEERFRPLLATSVTAIVSLLPLALTSPFWESIAFTLIFGLLSSTALVLLVFPYYYLGGEYLRMKIGRSSFLVWLIANAGAIFILNLVVSIGVAFQVMVAFNLGRLAWRLGRRFGLTRRA